jgi:hypothetical protein
MKLIGTLFHLIGTLFLAGQVLAPQGGTHFALKTGK